MPTIGGQKVAAASSSHVALKVRMDFFVPVENMARCEEAGFTLKASRVGGPGTKSRRLRHALRPHVWQVGFTWALHSHTRQDVFASCASRIASLRHALRHHKLDARSD